MRAVILSGANVTTGSLVLPQFLAISSEVDDVPQLPLEKMLRSADEQFRPMRKLKAGAGHAVHSRQRPIQRRVARADPRARHRCAHVSPCATSGRAAAAVVLHGDGVLVNVPAPKRSRCTSCSSPASASKSRRARLGPSMTFSRGRSCSSSPLRATRPLVGIARRVPSWTVVGE